MHACSCAHWLAVLVKSCSLHADHSLMTERVRIQPYHPAGSASCPLWKSEKSVVAPTQADLVMGEHAHTPCAVSLSEGFKPTCISHCQQSPSMCFLDFVSGEWQHCRPDLSTACPPQLVHESRQIAVQCRDNRKSSMIPLHMVFDVTQLWACTSGCVQLSDCCLCWVCLVLKGSTISASYLAPYPIQNCNSNCMTVQQPGSRQL
jgi:hypothetical protein